MFDLVGWVSLTLLAEYGNFEVGVLIGSKFIRWLK